MDNAKAVASDCICALAAAIIASSHTAEAGLDKLARTGGALGWCPRGIDATKAGFDAGGAGGANGGHGASAPVTVDWSVDLLVQAADTSPRALIWGKNVSQWQ